MLTAPRTAPTTPLTCLYLITNLIPLSIYILIPVFYPHLSSSPNIFFRFFQKRCWHFSSCVVIYCLSLNERRHTACASGGIGRLAGFRCRCSQGRAGSTPASRTTRSWTKVHDLVSFSPALRFNISHTLWEHEAHKSPKKKCLKFQI